MYSTDLDKLLPAGNYLFEEGYYKSMDFCSICPTNPQNLRYFFHLKNYFEVRYFKILNLDHVGVQFFIWSAIRPTVLHGTKFSTWRYPDTFHYALEIQLHVRYFKVLHVAETGSYLIFFIYFYFKAFQSTKFKFSGSKYLLSSVQLQVGMPTSSYR